MKKNLVATAVAFLAVTYAFSQTTWEQYNYVSKGYKTQVESGLDTKRGYVFTNITSTSLTSGSDIRNISVKALHDVSGRESKIVAYMIVYQLNNQEKEYICIPHPRSEKTMISAFVAKLHDPNIAANQSYRLQAITYALALSLKW